MASTPDSASYSRVIAQAWTDEAYKQRLMDDPVAVLTEAGVAVPDGVEVRVVENTETVAYLVLPAPPGEGEISEEALEQISGGSYYTGTFLLSYCCCG